MALYTQKLEKEKVLDISEQLQNDEYLKYQIQLYVNGLITTGIQGFRYIKVPVDDYKDMSILMADKECKEATLPILEDFGDRINEAVLEYPVNYQPENLKDWCIEEIIVSIPFYAKAEKGKVHVATLHLETREKMFDNDEDAGSCFEGYEFRPGRPATHSTWFDRDSKSRPKIITNEWETHDVNLLEAIRHSGEMFVEMRGPDMRIRY